MAAQHARQALWTQRGSRRYGAILVLVVASIIFQMASPDRPGFRVAAGVLHIVILVLALHSSDVHRHGHPAAIGVILGGGAALIAALAASGDTSTGLSSATSGVLVALTLVVIGAGVVRSVVEARQVTLQAVLGVVSVYLLIGLLFSYAYGVIAAFGDAQFFAQGTDGDHQDQLYFSFITQTTVGYGDFTPAGHLGRSLAAVEALIGQIYLVTIVALMVSNLRPRRPAEALEGSREPEA